MTHDDIQDWIDTYEEAWRTNSVAMLDSIFVSDIRYCETPWAEPIEGLSDLKNFWNEACARQGDFTLKSEIIALQNQTAVVRLDVKYQSDTPSSWKDIWVLRFNPKGLCSSYAGCPTSDPRESDSAA